MVSFEKRIASGSDDVEQRLSGSMSLTSSDLELVDDGAHTGQTVGLRFTNIAIPKGALITGAHIQFQADETGSGATSLLIRGQDAADAAAFTSSRGNVYLRPVTDASATWAPAAWTAVDQAGAFQQTPDLKSILQEIVDRPDWAAGNDMAFIITGAGTRTARAFESSPAKAPLLRVEYSLPDINDASPTIDLNGSAPGVDFETVFIENLAGVPIAADDASIQDADDVTMQRLVVTVTNPRVGDQLLLDPAALPAGIVVQGATASMITLAGGASPDDYELALGKVAFLNGSDAPDPVNRTIQVSVNDGNTSSSPVAATIRIDRTPDAVDDRAVIIRNTETVIEDVLANDDTGDGLGEIVDYDSTTAQGGVVLNTGSGSFLYSPPDGFLGADRFSYTLADLDGDRSTGFVDLDVVANIPRTFETRITSGSDDVEQSSSGSMSLTSSDLELVDDGSRIGQVVGLRFTNIGIPENAIITNAYIQFQTDETTAGLATLTIRGEDSDDAAAFTTSRSNASLRVKTDASAVWTPPVWTVVDEAGVDQRTPDIAPIIQEIVTRPGWAPGHDMAFFVTGSGVRTARAFEAGASKAPLLHVEWIAGEADEVAPSVSVTEPVEGAVVSGVVALRASASDNVGVQSVQFRIDSMNVGQPDATAPYSIEFDTSSESDGTVAVSAVATDLSGNQAASAPVSVTVDNSGAPPPPPPPPPSGTLRVPEDFATIQSAIDSAGNGDTILVAPGFYSGGLVISGKSISIASYYSLTGDRSIIEQTIIQGGSPAINITASAPNTTIDGFHFVGGDKPIQFFAPGGKALNNFFDNTGSDAVSLENVGGLVQGNRFFSSSDDGVDVDAATTDVIIQNNLFELSGDDAVEIRNQNYTGPHVTHFVRNNTIIGSDEDGIQIIDYASITNRSFVIEGNLIRTSAFAGIGLMDNGETVEDLRAASVPERVHVFNNTLDGNRVGISGGDNLVAVNNIVSNSSELGIKGVDAGSVIAHTLFFGNAADQVGSNVDAASTIVSDPLYTTGFDLQPGSPAIDAGVATFIHNGETVLTIDPSRYEGLAPDLGWML